MRQLQFLRRAACKRFQSSAAVSVSGNTHNISLDLDFVLGLLDSSSKGTETSITTNSLSWTRMKFRENEKEAEGNFSSFFAPLNPQASNSSESTLTRLQNLADSLPTQIYDKNGNLIPLNTSQPPMSFFEIDTPVVATTSANTITRTVPIFHRENVDWSTVTLTSILKKIVPEEAFIEQPTDAAESLDMIETNVNIMDALDTKDHVQEQFQCVFNQVELKLLDRDQLTAIAKHFNISSDQSDYKIEHELLTNVFKSASKRNATKNLVSKEKISWTEENEGLLLKIYEELRAEKHKVDQKLLQLLSNNNAPCSNTSSTPSLKRGHGASDRGLWAVLTDQFRQTAKFHVSVSECRNKLIILKRLKTH